MENMFRLADATPGANPLRGGDKGDSLAEHYEKILNELSVKGVATMTREGVKKYEQTLAYLAESKCMGLLQWTFFHYNVIGEQK